jgi:hypothetical protein
MSYEVGDGLFAIRCTSEAFGLRLDRALERYRSDREAALTRYSVVIADEPDGVLTKERFHILYKGTTALIRTTNLQALVRALVNDLETFFFPDRDDAMYADMVPVSVNGVTALLPEVLVPFLGTLGNRRVSRAGLRLPLDAGVAIDPTAGRILPIQPMVTADLDSLAGAFGADGDSATGDTGGRVTLAGPTGVDVLISIGWGDEPIQPASKGLALYRLASHVVNLPAFGARGLQSLKDLVEGARCYEMGSLKPAVMLRGLLTALEES